MPGLSPNAGNALQIEPLPRPTRHKHRLRQPMGWVWFRNVHVNGELGWVSKFPPLLQIVRRVLCISASSAQPERGFTSTGCRITGARTRLSSRKFEAIDHQLSKFAGKVEPHFLTNQPTVGYRLHVGAQLPLPTTYTQDINFDTVLHRACFNVQLYIKCAVIK